MESREAGVDIVLVRPSRPANVAAACRAMQNMGLGAVLLGGGGVPHGAEVRERAAVGRTAVVFGPESSGLRSDELDLCHARVHIPADAAHTSLNLAQAVLLVAYEIRLAVRPQVAPLPGRVATAGEIAAVLEALKKGLLAIGYLNPANPGA